MARAALEKQVDHCFVAFMRRPTDHVALVQVSGSAHVGAGVEQNPDALEPSACRREMEGTGIVTRVANVRIRSVIDQQAHRFRVVNRQVQRRGALRALVHKAAIALQ